MPPFPNHTQHPPSHTHITQPVKYPVPDVPDPSGPPVAEAPVAMANKQTPTAITTIVFDPNIISQIPHTVLTPIPVLQSLAGWLVVFKFNLQLLFKVERGNNFF